MPYYITATEGKTVQKILTFEESSEGLDNAHTAFVDTISEYADTREWSSTDFDKALKDRVVFYQHGSIQLIFV